MGCFVSITMSVPILKQKKGKPWIDYLAVHENMADG